MMLRALVGAVVVAAAAGAAGAKPEADATAKHLTADAKALTDAAKKLKAAAAAAQETDLQDKLEVRKLKADLVKQSDEAKHLNAELGKAKQDKAQQAKQYKAELDKLNAEVCKDGVDDVFTEGWCQKMKKECHGATAQPMVLFHCKKTCGVCIAAVEEEMLLDTTAADSALGTTSTQLSTGEAEREGEPVKQKAGMAKMAVEAAKKQTANAVEKEKAETEKAQSEGEGALKQNTSIAKERVEAAKVSVETLASFPGDMFNFDAVGAPADIVPLSLALIAVALLAPVVAFALMKHRQRVHSFGQPLLG